MTMPASPLSLAAPLWLLVSLTPAALMIALWLWGKAR